MTPLTRGEKKYIVDKVEDAFKTLFPKSGWEKLCNEFEDFKLKKCLEVPELKAIITNFKKMASFDLDKCTSIEYSTSEGGRLIYKINASYTYLSIPIYLNDKDLKACQELRDKMDFYLNHKDPWLLRIDYEFHYILFRTWKAKETERLDKINELIKMIVDKYTVV